MPSFFNQLKTVIECKLSLPAEHLLILPRSWKRIGRIAFVNLKEPLIPYRYDIGYYILTLLRKNNIRTVMHKASPIQGELRLPDLEHLAGEKTTVTTHVENKTKYIIDVSQVMFSAGNHHERIRMVNFAPQNKPGTVVDMFACIGNLSLAIANHRTDTKVIGIEKNPFAFKYLVKSIKANNLTNYKPILGDNRDKGITPQKIADRVILGYFIPDQHQIQLAIRALKPTGGILHVHEVIERSKNSKLVDTVQELLDNVPEDLSLVKAKEHIVKSVSSSKNHVVVDCFIERT